MRIETLKGIVKEGTRVKVTTNNHSYEGTISYMDDAVIVNTADGKVVIVASAVKELTVLGE